MRGLIFIFSATSFRENLAYNFAFHTLNVLQNIKEFGHLFPLSIFFSVFSFFCGLSSFSFHFVCFLGGVLHEQVDFAAYITVSVGVNGNIKVFDILHMMLLLIFFRLPFYFVSWLRKYFSLHDQSVINILSYPK